MAFSDFKYPAVLGELGLTYASAPDLFGRVPPVPPSRGLELTLPTMIRLGTMNSTEKARSEWLIAPLLADFWERYRGQIGVYSGVAFSADPDADLNGLCDFLISRAPQQTSVTPPAVVIVEAKNENIAGGLGQCVSAMVGAQRWNRRAGTPVEVVYGCSTTGTAWRFLQLAGTTLTADLTEYTSRDVDRILGILVHMIGPIPE